MTAHRARQLSLLLACLWAGFIFYLSHQPGVLVPLLFPLQDKLMHSEAIMGDDTKIKEGDTVKRTGRIAEMPVGDAVLGRVIDAVGQPLDGKGPINATEYRRVEMVAPDRKSTR